MTRIRSIVGSLAVVVVSVLGTAVSTVPTPLYPVYRAAMGIDTLGVTLTFAVFALGAVVGLGAAALLSRRMSRRVAYASGGAMQVGAALLLALDTGIAGFVAGRIVSGAGAGVLAASGTALMIELATTVGGRAGTALRALAPGLAFLGLGAGTAIGGLADARDLASVHLLFAAISTTIAAALLVSLATVPRRVGATAPGAQRRVPFPPAAGLGGFLAFTATGLFGSVVTVMLDRVLPGGPIPLAGLLVALVFGTAALAIVGLSGRVGARPAASVLILAVAAVAASVATASFPTFVVASLFAGGAGGLLFAHSLRAAVSVAPEVAFRQTSLVFACAYAGLSLPVVGLGIALTTLPTAIALAVFALVTLLLGLVLLALLRGGRKGTTESEKADP